MTIPHITAILAFSLVATLAPTHAAEPPKPFKIEVVDKENGWPIPLAILKTTNDVQFITDNAGVIAFDMPGLLDREVWFNISADGYEVPKDGLGSQGQRFVTKPGGTQRIELKRTNIAKRLGRITGEGQFDQSKKLGEHLDWKESGVMGQDTAYEVPYKGKRFWIWGDTNTPTYALGLYQTPGGTSALKPIGKFEPPIKLVFDYFRNKEGGVRNICEMKGSGPTWISALVALPDSKGQVHLLSTYSKIVGNHDMSPYDIGLAEWNEKTQNFDSILTLWTKESGKPLRDILIPNGHPFYAKDASGKEWLYLGEGLPSFKCPATYEAWKDPKTWRKVENPRKLKTADGGEVDVQTGAVAWNPYRKKYIAIFQEGMSDFGSVWYAEASSPEGPWGKAVRVASHDKMTFYNPLQHPDVVPADAKFIVFEGTYTKTFTNEPPTPYYEYNQLLYRLDLDDPALKPAQE